MQLLLISGLSGSGKSIALNVLEDAGYFCVDNLPSPLLPQLVGQLHAEGSTRVAVAMDCGVTSQPHVAVTRTSASEDSGNE